MTNNECFQSVIECRCACVRACACESYWNMLEFLVTFWWLAELTVSPPPPSSSSSSSSSSQTHTHARALCKRCQAACAALQIKAHQHADPEDGSSQTLPVGRRQAVDVPLRWRSPRSVGRTFDGTSPFCVQQPSGLVCLRHNTQGYRCGHV